MRAGLILSLLLHGLALVPLLFVLAPSLGTTPGTEAAIPTRFVAHTVNIEALQPRQPPTLKSEAIPPVVSEAKEAATVTPIQPETVEPALPEPTPERVALRDPEPPPKPEPLPEAEPPPKPELAPEPEPEQQQAPKEPEPLPEPEEMPEPEPQIVEEPAVAQPESPTDERLAMTHAPPSPGAASPAQKVKQAAGAGAEPDADYLMEIRALLEQHKQYPLMAQRLRMEGDVRLWFVLNRRGEVLNYRIDKGSGHAMLDQEVERLIEQIDAFPPVPPDLHLDKLELVVPVSFRLAG
jgi:protein TonB